MSRKIVSSSNLRQTERVLKLLKSTKVNKRFSRRIIQSLFVSKTLAVFLGSTSTQSGSNQKLSKNLSLIRQYWLKKSLLFMLRTLLLSNSFLWTKTRKKPDSSSLRTQMGLVSNHRIRSVLLTLKQAA